MATTNDHGIIFDSISELKEDTGIIKTDIYWIKQTLLEINGKQNKCNVCSNAEYIYDQANINRNDIRKLQDDRNIGYGITVAISILVSSIVALIELGILKV